ncbi:unnamed protein product [Soboliphyme baturini]|uniref:Surfeit locus protein 4 n=1 Tax=Soboliphyme baturini TaxID=241478 RepID=A0A183J0Y9_9BILA|nr:unnamed protein product [Soboliphyme baturini]
MWYQFEDQREWMKEIWKVNVFFANLFVIFNLFGQIVPCILILLRKQVVPSCCVLGAIVVLQAIAYQIFWDFMFLARRVVIGCCLISVAVGGGLLLLLAEAQADSQSLFAGVPQMSDTYKPKSIMQFAGRILLIFMFISLMKFELSFIRIVELVVGGALMTLVSIGYKTKLSALVLVIWLTCLNFYLNPWWKYPKERYYVDVIKYDFFQTLSVIGGLLLVILLGPGGVSMDDYKKRW